MHQDEILKIVENSSPIRLVQDEKQFLSDLDYVMERLQNIKVISPKDIENLEALDTIPYMSHKFTIPNATFESETFVIYDCELSVSVKNDLIGLFKSFSISMAPCKIIC